MERVTPDPARDFTGQGAYSSLDSGDAVKIRPQHEKAVRWAAWSHLLVAACCYYGGVWVALSTMTEGRFSMLWPMALFLIMGTGFLFSGMDLLRLNPRGRMLAIILHGLIIFNVLGLDFGLLDSFRIGILSISRSEESLRLSLPYLSVLVLYVLLSSKGRGVLSPEYREMVSRKRGALT